jgi:hypothetical protein
MWAALSSFLNTHLVLSCSCLLLLSVTLYELVFGVVRENAKFSDAHVWRRIWLILKWFDVLTTFPKVRRGIKNWIRFGAGVLLGMVIMGIWSDRQYPIYEYTDADDGPIVVLNSAIGGNPYSWLIRKNDGEFKVDWCHDYNVPGLCDDSCNGVLVSKLRYQDRSTCASIRRSDLGIWWKLDKVTHIVLYTRGGN